MVRLRFLFFISGLFFSGMMLSQEVNVTILEGFKKGDAKSLSPYFAEHVEYIGPEKDGTFNNREVTKLLSQFFSNHKVLDFKIKHSGRSPSGSTYSIGLLSTSMGVYRTYLLFNARDNKKISEIRLEKDE